MTGAVFLLSLVTLGRLGELVLARANTRRLLAMGAREVAPGHYPVIVLLHTLWLAALWVFGTGQPVNAVWLVVFLGLQIVRVWVLATLGSRWTTRILIVPGETLVARGPYKYFSHPNYIVVIGEIAVLPLCLGLTWVAVLFSVLNAAVLTIRIRAENEGLMTVRPNAQV
ncbi:MAG: isoprenylcysteine carboxyl methyltransferase family protein [Paracoccaceae bacterium]